MKLNKNFYLLLLGCLFTIIPIFISCGDDEPRNPHRDNSIDSPSSGEGNISEEKINIEKLIRENVSVSISYEDYITTFTIVSRLKSKLANKSIEYGVGHWSSSISMEEVVVSVGNQAYEYSVKNNGSVETITIRNPFWFYFAFVNEDNQIWANCEMYFASYLSLKDKEESNWTSGEKSLYNNLIKNLNQYEKEAKTDYVPVIECLIDGRFYEVQSFPVFWKPG